MSTTVHNQIENTLKNLEQEYAGSYFSETTNISKAPEKAEVSEHSENTSVYKPSWQVEQNAIRSENFYGTWLFEYF